MTPFARLAVPALAQTPRTPETAPQAPTRDTVLRDRNTTGSTGDKIVAPGSTGASTMESNSAAGGNASQPERRVPQGSGGAGGP